ncbi:MAG: SCO family protein [Vicinamibacterales bacterium]
MTRGVLRSVVLAAALAGAGAASGCREHRDALPVAQSQAAGLASTDEDASLFALDLTFTDQDGRRVALRDLGGHVTLAAMMYSSCTSICPRVVEEMKAVERRLPPADRSGVHFVLFSIDAAHDTPETLRHFAGEHQLDTARWRLLVASEDGVRDLAAVLGLKYRLEPSGDIAHSAMLFVIDRTGVVRHRIEGTGTDSATVVAALERARG